MLLDLSIRDFALAHRLELEFEPGLTVFTGETGAGKSIVIGAMTAATGARVGAEHVREGADRAWIEATFAVEAGSPVYHALKEAELGDDETVLLTREILATGRSKYKINDRTVTQAQFAEIGRLLVDVHGQHDNQSLLQASKHLDLLDALGGESIARLKEETGRLYDERARLREEIVRLQESEREAHRREDLLHFQIEEISAAALEPGEEERLDAEWSRLTHAEKLGAAVQAAYKALYDGGGDSLSATQMVGDAVRTLQTYRSLDPELASLIDPIEEALHTLEEAARELRRYGEHLESDPVRLEEVEARRHLLHRLKRKYGETIDEIIAFMEQCQAELDALTTAADRLQSLIEREREVASALADVAMRLSRARRELAERVNERVTARLASLGMPAARFEAAFSYEDDPEGVEIDEGPRRVRVTRHGIDTVEFLFTANPGESLRPLAKIASGGEMSRVMLAIKATMAEAEPKATLIFDEVDAGLGGQTAERVADALAQLATVHQVLVVTHLAQIAVRADRHFLVEKSEEGGRVKISLRLLTGDERVTEIGRMLDGLTTATSLEHAQALLERARSGASSAAHA